MTPKKLELANKLWAAIQVISVQIEDLDKSIEHCSRADDAALDGYMIFLAHKPLNGIVRYTSPTLPASKFKAVFEKERADLQRELIKKQRQFNAIK